MSAHRDRRGLSPILAMLAGCACGGRGSEIPREPALPGFVWIPAGDFVFGCDAREVECPEHERPRRTVRLPAFQIGVYEVTEREYAACTAAGVCVDPQPHYDGAPLLPPRANENVGEEAVAGAPTDGASQVPIRVYAVGEARAFCAWRGLRLPTSVEWEKAARGVDGRSFPWGSEQPDCERAAHCTREVFDHVFAGGTDPVGSHPGGRSPYGLEDMAGNVGEWTECPPDIPACVGIVRSPEHEGPDGLRTYAGYVAAGALFMPGAGFRCAK